MELTLERISLHTCELIQKLAHPQLWALNESEEFQAVFLKHAEKCDICRHKIRDAKEIGYNNLPKEDQSRYLSEGLLLASKLQY